MKMVAASKMRQDVARLERAKFFGVGSINKIIQNETFLHKKKTPTTGKKTMLVPITSDKGLCGGVNSSIVREVKAIVKELKYKVDINTLRKIEDDPDFALNEIGRVQLRTSAPLFYDSYKNNRITGSFVLIDEQTNETVAAGMIV